MFSHSCRRSIIPSAIANLVYCVDRRYKQLLLKQRDIMIALTARLNERDEQIMTLQVKSSC